MTPMVKVKRLGARRIEDLWGAGVCDSAPPGKRRPLVEASLVEEIRALAAQRLARVTPAERTAFARLAPTVVVATTDVHEHGKLALEVALGALGAQLIDGGVSVDADDLADAVRASGGQAVLVSTYNGIALDYVRALKRALGPNGVPILVGGRLNQVPAGSNTSLPVDVSGQLESEGANPASPRLAASIASMAGFSSANVSARSTITPATTTIVFPFQARVG